MLDIVGLQNNSPFHGARPIIFPDDIFPCISDVKFFFIMPNIIGEPFILPMTGTWSNCDPPLKMKCE